MWYDKYYEKTNAQLKSFRKLGFETHVMTVKSSNKELVCEIGDIDDDMDSYNTFESITISKLYGLGFFLLFKAFFKYVSNKKSTHCI